MHATSPCSHDSWGPQGCTRPSSSPSYLCHRSGAFIGYQKLYRSYKSLESLTLAQAQDPATLYQGSVRTPLFQVHTFLPAVEWEGENHERCPLAICSVLCCLNNIQNERCGKSLIYCHSFCTVLVHFYIFTPSKYWKQIKFSKIEDPGNTANNYSCQAWVFSTCTFAKHSNWFALYTL